MEIRQNLKYLYDLNRLGIKTSLDNIKILCRELGNPQEYFPIIHIAGTNGKGTTAALLQNLLSEAGFRCGLYTSPHLRHFGERIRIGGKILSDEQASAYIKELKPLFDRTQSTFFESATAMAFLYFKREKADIAVVETGLGGTWDATNIVNPVISVFTPISLDHIDRLGNEIGQIAADKAGIIKAGGEVVSAEQTAEANQEIQAKAASLNCSFHYAPEAMPIIKGTIDPSHSSVLFSSKYYADLNDDWQMPLPGRHQWVNLQTALTAAAVLRGKGFDLPVASLKRGVETVKWAGRLQIMQEAPLVYFDVGHNPGAAKVIKEFFLEVFPEQKPRILMGIVSDKDINGVLRELSFIAADFTFVALPTPRSVEPELLAVEAAASGNAARVIKDPAIALKTILAETSPDKIILIAGSHYLGEVVLQHYSPE